MKFLDPLSILKQCDLEWESNGQLLHFHIKKNSFVFFKSSPKDTFLLILEREREERGREGEREKH